ncbi:MAG TPA: ABC transporter permease [Blastocatellia bacterium]
METFIKDVRYAARLLIRQPGFSMIALVALALGIGANTAIFSVVNTVLIRPLPYKNPERLVAVWETFPNVGKLENPVTPANFFDWKEQCQSFEDMTYYVSQPLTLTGGGEPEKIEGVYSADNFLHLFGVEAAMGRIFMPGEATRAGDFGAAVISYGLWKRRFGSDPDIIGKQINVDTYAVQIVGVMPASFQYPSKEIDLWVPTAMSAEVARQRNAAHYLRVVGRLKEGVSYEQADAEIRSIAARLEEQYPATNRNLGARINPLREQFFGGLRLALFILLAATAFVLLIACANVANLMLARAASRQREIAIRLALGAGRWRIIRQLLTESLLLSVAGGAAGLLMALWSLEALKSMMPATILQAGDVSIDGRVLAFTFLISILTGIFFGLAPALQATKPALNETLKEGSRDSGTRRSKRLRSLLVVAEIALVLVLMIGAGLMLNSFLRLQRIDPGFKSENLLTMEVYPPYSKYPDTERRAAFYDQLIARVEAMAGVESAGVVNVLPMKTALGEMRYITDHQPQPKFFNAIPTVISPDYFRTMGISVLKGRDFTSDDTQGKPGVIIINEAMARKVWPDEEPVGKRLKMGVPENPWLTVAGVVRDVQLAPGADPPPQAYMPYAQIPNFGPRYLVVRSASDPTGLIAVIRDEVSAVDPDQPLASASLMEEVMSESLSRQRFNMALLVIFAALALALASVGIYGVMSYTVTQSTREIGIRLALGAQPTDVLKLVTKQGFLLTAAGVGAGVVASFALTRLMSNLLYGVTATDPLTFVFVSMLLLLVAMLACYIPARRATRVDPIVALRYE